MNTTKDIETEIISEEQERVIMKLEEVLNFLKSVKIRNEEALDYIKKPLDHLESSLKYLPTDISLNILPMEIKTGILGYLCDSEAFTVASVCQEWKDILTTKFEGKRVIIGTHCKDCKDNDCFKPEEMLKASAVHGLNVHLSICHPVTEVDSKIITDGLLSVSNFTIDGDCDCGWTKSRDDDDDSIYDFPILTTDQLEHLFEGIERNEKVMNGVKFRSIDLTNLSQDRLANCLVNKVKKLCLDKGDNLRIYGVLDVPTFLRKLQQDFGSMELGYLELCNLEAADYLASQSELADAVCLVPVVHLHECTLKTKTIQRLLVNILTRPINLNVLRIDCFVDYETLLSPEDLRNLFNKIPWLQLLGNFTLEQLHVAWSIPNVKLHVHNNRKHFRISKGFIVPDT